MSNAIELKSKVIKVFDYKDVDISSFIVHFEPDMQIVEKELLKIRKKYSEYVEAKEVLAGDIAILSCKSDNKRFNKESINVIVGKGLFSKELENNLLGMKKAEDKEFTINGDKVSVHINKITRSVIPELTDENVIKWNFEGLKSTKEIRKWVINKQQVDFLEDDETGYAVEASAYIQKQVMERSSFVLDEGECSRVEQEAVEKVKDIVRGLGMSLETITKEQAQEMLGSSIDDYIGFMKGIYNSSLKVAVLGNKLMKEELHPLTIEDYEVEAKKYSESKGIDIEEAKKLYTIENFMNQYYGEYYYDTLLKYVVDYLIAKDV